MATLVSAVSTTFVPATGSFVIQCTGGEARLDRRLVTGAAWTTVGTVGIGNSAIVDNPVAGVEYNFVTVTGTPVVRADQ